MTIISLHSLHLPVIVGAITRMIMHGRDHTVGIKPENFDRA
jgi:hypothetical protein